MSDHLVKMANQIAINIPASSPEAKAKNTANHIDKFWSPSMKAQIKEHASQGGAGLNTESLRAIGLLS
ncbi:MAG: formate dehydrogenase subunit delta [Porticoccaceae bacterium]|nr:formate dehydrogenase subunit delta [Porticoccaceae bacterium]